MTSFPAEQFVYMPAATKRRTGYQVVAKSPGVSEKMLAQMDAYMFPPGVGRGFSRSKSLVRLRGRLVAYSNVLNSGTGYDGRPDALYNHTLILSDKSFAGIGFDTRILDAYFVKSPPRHDLPSVSVEGRALSPRISQRCRHLTLPVLRALFRKQSVAVSGVDDPSFLPNVLAMLPHSMRMLPFSTCLPDHSKQPAYRLATYDKRVRSVPKSFAHLSGDAPAGGDDLDDAVMFLMGRASSADRHEEVLSEFDRISAATPRAKLVLLHKVFGVSSSPSALRARRAEEALVMLRKFDAGTRSRLMRRIEPFLDARKPPHTRTLDEDLAGEKITAKLIKRLLDGVPEHNKRRLLKAVYGARRPDFEKNAGILLAGMHDSPHAPDVCRFFVATESLHPHVLKFLSGKTHMARKHRRRAQCLLLPTALKEGSGLALKILKCGAYDKHSKDDARDMRGMLEELAKSEQAGSVAARGALAPSGSSRPGERQAPESISPETGPGRGGTARRQPVRRLRDPIHGFIDVYENEMAVIQDPVFQRLRRIKQLSFAHLVYHGAEHSRFGHVLGTMHLADRALRSIKSNSERPGNEIISDEDVRTARMAALLHDVGHRPLSHTLDPIFEESHEDISEALVLGRFARMIEGAESGVDPKQVANLIQRRLDEQKPFLSEIISGQLDVDKMDYLLRDSYYAGVKYGMFDLDMLMDSLVLAGNDLAVSSKGIMAAEQMIIARYHMFGQVYHHKTKRSFESMAQRVASHLLQDGDLEYPSAKSLSNEADDLVVMDDAWLMKALNSVRDKDMKGISDDLLARKPFEEVLNSDNLDLKNGSSESAIGYFTAVEQSVYSDLESIGVEQPDIISDKSSVLPYRLFPYPRDPYEDRDMSRVLIRYSKSEHGVPIEQKSKVVRAIALDFIVHRMFAHKSKVDDLRAYLERKYPGTRDSQRS